MPTKLAPSLQPLNPFPPQIPQKPCSAQLASHSYDGNWLLWTRTSPARPFSWASPRGRASRKGGSAATRFVQLRGRSVRFCVFGALFGSKLLGVKVELGAFFAQGVAVEAEDLGCLELVTVGVVEDLAQDGAFEVG